LAEPDGPFEDSSGFLPVLHERFEFIRRLSETGTGYEFRTVPVSPKPP
jgi:hypothetical protein